MVIVFFTSDNGPEGDGHGDPENPGSQRDRTRGVTGGLRGRKRADFEGGIRVPGIVRWPGMIRPGTESSTPVIGSDIFATSRLWPLSDANRSNVGQLMLGPSSITALPHFRQKEFL